MKRLGKPQRLEIYPPAAPSASNGHNFLYLRVDEWEPDVFDFLDKYCGGQAARRN